MDCLAFTKTMTSVHTGDPDDSSLIIEDLVYEYIIFIYNLFYGK